MKNNNVIKRGQVWYCDLSGNKGSEQGGYRPCLIIQNDVGNRYSPTTIIAIITSRNTKAKLPTHYWIKNKEQCGLKCESMVECEQIRTIDKARLKNLMGELPKEELKIVDEKLKISLQI